MKMKLMVLVATLFAAQAAFATDYSCGPLKDSEGHVLVGGPGYSLVRNGSEVILQVSNGAVAPVYHKTVEYKMEKVPQNGPVIPDLVQEVYKADGVLAIFSYSWGREFVGIQVDKLSAPCSEMENFPVVNN